MQNVIGHTNTSTAVAVALCAFVRDERRLETESLMGKPMGDHDLWFADNARIKAFEVYPGGVTRMRKH